MIPPPVVSSARYLLSCFFPEKCLCCQELHESSFCQNCIRCLPKRNEHSCPQCQEHLTPLGAVCSRCWKISSIDGIFSATYYQHPTVSRLISAYKYQFIQPLVNPLATILLESLLENNLPLPDALLAIPIYPKRLRWRGFDQSEILAEKIARNILPNASLPLIRNVSQKRYTLPQVETKNRKDRLENMRDAFIFFGDPHHIKNKRLWIIDDVSTTGATLSAYASLLKRKGAKEVWGVVVAS